METNEENLKLYPRYRRLARDFLFFFAKNVRKIEKTGNNNNRG